MLFKRFVLYFKEKAHAITDISDPKKSSVLNFPLIQFKEPSHQMTQVKSFMKDIPIDRYCLDENEKSFLTPREMKCLLLISQGVRASNVAKELGVSPKTVGAYLSKVCQKMSCQSRHEVVEAFLDYKNKWFLSHAD